MSLKHIPIILFISFISNPGEATFISCLHNFYRLPKSLSASTLPSQPFNLFMTQKPEQPYKNVKYVISLMLKILQIFPTTSEIKFKLNTHFLKVLHDLVSHFINQIQSPVILPLEHYIPATQTFLFLEHLQFSFLPEGSIMTVTSK